MENPFEKKLEIRLEEIAKLEEMIKLEEVVEPKPPEKKKEILSGTQRVHRRYK